MKGSIEQQQKPPRSDYAKAQIATEDTFDELILRAKRQGLALAPCMGLMYLPTQELTRAFQDACRGILMALTDQATHVQGTGEEQGKEFWQGEDTD